MQIFNSVSIYNYEEYRDFLRYELDWKVVEICEFFNEGRKLQKRFFIDFETRNRFLRLRESLENYTLKELRLAHDRAEDKNLELSMHIIRMELLRRKKEKTLAGKQ